MLAFEVEAQVEAEADEVYNYLTPHQRFDPKLRTGALVDLV